MRYRIKVKVIVQHEAGGQCRVFTKYIRRASIKAALLAKSKFLTDLRNRRYEIIEETSTGGWVR